MLQVFIRNCQWIPAFLQHRDTDLVELKRRKNYKLKRINQEFSRTRTRAHPAIYTFCFHNLHHFSLNIIYYSNIQHIYNTFFWELLRNRGKGSKNIDCSIRKIGLSYTKLGANSRILWAQYKKVVDFMRNLRLFLRITPWFLYRNRIEKQTSCEGCESKKCKFPDMRARTRALSQFSTAPLLAK